MKELKMRKLAGERETQATSCVFPDRFSSFLFSVFSVSSVVSFPFQMPVREVHVPLPIVQRDVVLSLAQVVADGPSQDWLVDAGHLLGRQALLAEQPVDRGRMHAGQE